jgi:hypothetical protein
MAIPILNNFFNEKFIKDSTFLFDGKRLPTNSPSKMHMNAVETKILLLDR